MERQGAGLLGFSQSHRSPKSYMNEASKNFNQLGEALNQKQVLTVREIKCCGKPSTRIDSAALANSKECITTSKAKNYSSGRSECLAANSFSFAVMQPGHPRHGAWEQSEPSSVDTPQIASQNLKLTRAAILVVYRGPEILRV